MTPTIEDLASLNVSYWILQTVVMLITAALIPNLRITSIFGAILIVVALAFVNSKVWDAALFFHIPNTLSYQSLLLFLTNGLIFWLLIKILPGIEVDGIIPALVAPIIFTLTSLVISKFAAEIDWLAILDKIITVLQNLRDYFQEAVPVSTVPEQPTPGPS